MYTLQKTFKFEASHQLPNHDGKCQRLHGHSWIGTLVVQGTDLAKIGCKQGMLVDYSDLSAAVKPLLDGYLDHHHLNETTGLTNPTSEELAKWVFNRLRPFIPQLVAVKIDETCSASCEYRPDQE